MTNYEIGHLWSFSEALINTEPNEPGVYVLFDGDEVIKIGETEYLKIRLLQHFNGIGDGGNCTKHATHYCVEITIDHKAREGELLAAYIQEYDALPRCHKIAA